MKETWSCLVSHCIKRRKDALPYADLLGKGQTYFGKPWGGVRDVTKNKEWCLCKKSFYPSSVPSSVLCLFSQKEARNSCQTDFGFAVGWQQGFGSRGTYLEALLIPNRYLWVKSLSTLPRWGGIAHSSVSPVWPEHLLSNFPKLILRNQRFPCLDFRGKQKNL